MKIYEVHCTISSQSVYFDNIDEARKFLNNLKSAVSFIDDGILDEIFLYRHTLFNSVDSAHFHGYTNDFRESLEI